MTEETEPLEPVETQPPVERPKKEGILGLIDRVKGGKGGQIDPLTMILLMDQLRAMRRDEERWEIERKKLKEGDSDSKQKPVDVDALITKLDEKWEGRFEKYTDSLEQMFMGKKLEDTEARAEVAEEKLKAKEEKEEQEKLVEEKIEPLETRIGELQVALAQKTAGMTNQQKKDVFADIGEKIRDRIGGSVGDKIADTITTSLDEAFAAKEDEVAVTKEGKVDYSKQVFKSINKGLGVLEKYIEKMPAGPPEVKEVKKMPEAGKPPLTPEQQRILEKVQRGEELAPPPAPPAPAEVREEEKAPPPKKPPEKPKEEKPPEEKKPPPTEKPKEEKPIVKEPEPKPLVEKKKEVKPKPVAKTKPKEKPKEEKKPVLPIKEKPVKVAEKTKEKPKRTKTRGHSKTTEKSTNTQTS